MELLNINLSGHITVITSCDRKIWQSTMSYQGMMWPSLLLTSVHHCRCVPLQASNHNPKIFLINNIYFYVLKTLLNLFLL
jgi:hypothetical protein